MKLISLCRVNSIFILPCHHPVEGKKVYPKHYKKCSDGEIDLYLQFGVLHFPGH